ncbi:DUF72 domain-containing protein, partial [Streptomyces sp. NPDC004599]
RYYAGRFPVVEADSPYYALPAPATTRRWEAQQHGRRDRVTSGGGAREHGGLQPREVRSPVRKRH